MTLPLAEISTPAYVIDAAKIRKNLEIVDYVRRETQAKILLALKAFAIPDTFELFKNKIDGTAASGRYEAQMGAQAFGGETHVYSPAFKKEDMLALRTMVDHISFNSLGQFNQFKGSIDHQKISCGLRINPEVKEVKTEIYNPCASHSRLGMKSNQLPVPLPPGIRGLHIHALCENMADSSVRLLDQIEDKLGDTLKTIDWLNIGGGHYMTHTNYDLSALIKRIIQFQETHSCQLYLEPGGALVYDAGYLVASVVDILPGSPQQAILDASATTHMPDVLEMPYRPHIVGSDFPEKWPYTYILGGPSCLAGDVIGRYSFRDPLHIGQRLVFTDMAQYTMVKTTTFNGIPLPTIGILDENSHYTIIRTPSYSDFYSRLSDSIL